MKISKFFLLFFALILFNGKNAFCEDMSHVALTSIVQTTTKEPIALSIKDIYESLVKIPIVKLINKIKKVMRYRKVLRWSRIWWILFVREVVGDNKIEKATEKQLRNIWDECTIAVYNNTLNSVESKPLLFLHGILNECKNNFSTKLGQDPSLIVVKMDQILKTEIYRYWVAKKYLIIGRSDIFYKKVTPSLVPLLPKEHTLKYVSSNMEKKLKSLESKKNIEENNYDISIQNNFQGVNNDNLNIS